MVQRSAHIPVSWSLTEGYRRASRQRFRGAVPNLPDRDAVFDRNGTKMSTHLERQFKASDSLMDRSEVEGCRLDLASSSFNTRPSPADHCCLDLQTQFKIWITEIYVHVLATNPGYMAVLALNDAFNWRAPAVKVERGQRLSASEAVNEGKTVASHTTGLRPNDEALERLAHACEPTVRRP